MGGGGGGGLIDGRISFDHQSGSLFFCLRTEVCLMLAVNGTN